MPVLSRTSDGRLRLSTHPGFVAGIGLGVEHFPCFRNQRRELNHHDLVEMTCVVRGTLTCHLDDGSFALTPGSLAVCHFGQGHSLVTGPAGCELYNLYLDPARMALPSLPEQLQQALTRFLPLHPALVHRANRVASVEFPAAESPVPLLAAMVAENSRRQTGWQQALALLGQQLLLACARRVLVGGPAPLHLSPRNDADSGRMYAVCAHLDAHLDEAVALDAVATIAGVGQAQLARLFRRHTGSSVIAYLRQRRVERAMVLLATSRRTVADIALACGFGDLSHFHATFRRLAGTTPAAYRARATRRP